MGNIIQQLDDEQLAVFDRVDNKTIVDLSSSLSRVQYHLEIASTLLVGRALFNFEPSAVAIHLRLSVEYLMQLSFAGNRLELEKSGKILASEKKLGKLRSQLNEVNPNFWPVPIQPYKRPGANGNNEIKMELGKSIMPSTEVLRIWGTLSEYLHAETLRRKQELRVIFSDFKTLHTRLQHLATQAGIELTQSTEWLLWSIQRRT